MLNQVGHGHGKSLFGIEKFFDAPDITPLNSCEKRQRWARLCQRLEPAATVEIAAGDFARDAAPRPCRFPPTSARESRLLG